MSDRDAPLRAQIIAICQALDMAGMVPNKSGNVSCRSVGGFLITPAGVPYRDLTPRDIFELAVDVERLFDLLALGDVEVDPVEAHRRSVGEG